ncbi:hypothetical protein HanXRQr2_Chr10g0438011 [Helianthus annuus]|uniref:Uncharacterized protein n=1 Tax=Helianthus annuus TaxID=4232 RepID=A0A9K3N3Q3_HELAN|nr:hypothetical protein HanXRQr2_Chr10g0438011 [Helianthus annuus]KAJ0521535.1 hypothetical protein HanIR_Chr10g0472041 [Helianthus annuus]KAJ0700091.1 hypothetical protein HanOQP8_Chr10g0363641 [Helianthus annuus]KAJ0883551.1 hypothetical protein HanPSC8_Chr10g0422871 [Helianthus annuus]
MFGLNTSQTQPTPGRLSQRRVNSSQTGQPSPPGQLGQTRVNSGQQLVKL